MEPIKNALSPLNNFMAPLNLLKVPPNSPDFKVVITMSDTWSQGPTIENMKSPWISTVLYIDLLLEPSLWHCMEIHLFSEKVE